MWLYVPEQLSACSAESEPSISPSDEFFQSLSASSTWRGKSRLWRLWRLAWKRTSWMPRRFGPTFARSQQALSEDVLTWWQGAFPARISPRPEDGLASTVIAPVSSSDSWTSFATWNAATSSWRTSQQSLFEDSTPFSGRWPKAGSMHAGAVSERPTLARHISEIAGGASHGTGGRWATPEAMNFDKPMTEASPQDSIGAQARRWTASARPTPCASDTGRSERNAQNRIKSGHQADLSTVVSLWQTPRVSFASRRSGARSSEPLLPDQAKQWATPSAGVFNDTESPESWRARQATLKAKGINGNGAGVPLGIQAQEFGPASPQAPTTETAGDASSPSTPILRLQLNERFVEALMGLRPGWTDFGDSATPSCPSRPKQPCASSGSAPSESSRD